MSEDIYLSFQHLSYNIVDNMSIKLLLTGDNILHKNDFSKYLSGIALPLITCNINLPSNIIGYPFFSFQFRYVIRLYIKNMNRIEIYSYSPNFYTICEKKEYPFTITNMRYYYNNISEFKYSLYTKKIRDLNYHQKGRVIGRIRNCLTEDIKYLDILNNIKEGTAVITNK